jgi:RNA polymerase sigma factor (sigma-70 family)
MPIVTDRLLVEAALLGDRGSFDRLYHRYARVVYDAAFAVLDHPDESETVTQDVWVITWNKLDRVELGSGTILPWLLGVAAGEIRNAARRLGRRAHVTGMDRFVEAGADPDPVHTSVTTTQLLAKIEREVAGMRHADADVYRCLIVEGLSYDETAAVLRMSAGNVGKRMNRVRSHLKKRLAEDRL